MTPRAARHHRPAPPGRWPARRRDLAGHLPGVRSLDPGPFRPMPFSSDRKCIDMFVIDCRQTIVRRGVRLGEHVVLFGDASDPVAASRVWALDRGTAW